MKKEQMVERGCLTPWFGTSKQSSKSSKPTARQL